jgi:hypothetical protein
MINGYIILGMLCMLAAPLAAFAQPQPTMSPEAQALAITGWIGSLVQETTNLRAQNAQLQQENAALKAQAAAKPAEAPKLDAPK